MLIVQFNNYQNAKFFTSANNIAGGLFATITDIGDYFGLKEENENLLQYNKKLNQEIADLRAELATYKDSTTVSSLTPTHGFYFETATIVNNTVNAINNYITIDKGSADGIIPEMGVFADDGVIGIVYMVSQHYSIVVPLLNSKSRLSCIVNGDKNFATLQWEGGDTEHSYLVDLQRYSKITEGDTVVTSGYSSIFPGNIPVGRIEKIEDSADGMYHRAKVKLFTDFTSISKVFLVGNEKSKEQKELEKKVTGDDK